MTTTYAANSPPAETTSTVGHTLAHWSSTEPRTSSRSAVGGSSTTAREYATTPSSLSACTSSHDSASSGRYHRRSPPITPRSSAVPGRNTALAASGRIAASSVPTISKVPAAVGERQVSADHDAQPLEGRRGHHRLGRAGRALAVDEVEGAGESGIPGVARPRRDEAQAVARLDARAWRS